MIVILIKRLISFALNIQTLWSLYVTIWCISTVLSPTGSGAMKALIEFFGNPQLPTTLMVTSAILTFLGLLISRNPIQMWFFNIPFVFTACITSYALVINSRLEGHPLALTSLEHLIFIILIMVALTWDKINE